MKLRQSGRVFAIFCAVLGACEGSSDPAVPDASVDVIDAAPAADADPSLLSSRGLYSDISTHTIAPEAVAYTPNYALWSDSAAKRRWIVLPPNTKIDTSDMDHWQFPVGTKLWKEFATPDGKLLETRLIEKKEDGTFFFGSFIWQEDGLDAKLTQDGATDILGTQHDVPNKARCLLCHKGEAGRVLGFSALQLSKDGAAPTLTSLAAAGLLSNPPPSGVDYRFPGDSKAKAALGYLHANCGHCHTDGGSAYADTCIVNPDTGAQSECMQLQFSVTDVGRNPMDSKVVKSLIGIVTHSNQFEGTPRLTPGDPERSAIWIRPSMRGGTVQMPPAFSTEEVDMAGLAAIEAWINSL
jgi:hypothetical protein